MNDDTIAAISTPVGEGGIGIVRISGAGSRSLFKNIFRKNTGDIELSTSSSKLIYGYIVDPVSDQILDEVLISFRSAPHTYTREDTLEINCHSGLVSLRRILTLVLSQGARLAEPGEFTKRAFLNGRIDLSQAEAVMQLIRSKTDRALEISLKQLAGGLSEKINSLREEIVTVAANLEAELDFPEEELELMSAGELAEKLSEASEKTESLLEEAEKGKIFRQGVKTAIIGKPNTGKSSLLNAMLREQRAIVTEIPGTTRDTIEEGVVINGIPLSLIDTAGIRVARNKVEEIGIRMAKDKLTEADLILLVIDSSRPLKKEDLEIASLVEPSKTIVVLNKSDLKPDKATNRYFEKSFTNIFKVSALKHQGIKELEDGISELLQAVHDIEDRDMITLSLRQEKELQAVLKCLEEAKELLEEGQPFEIAATVIKEALDHLGRITGTTTDDEILQEIFKNFCIGK